MAFDLETRVDDLTVVSPKRLPLRDDVAFAEGAVASNGALPSASDSYRGYSLRTEGTTGTADTWGKYLKNASDTTTLYYPLTSLTGNLVASGIRRNVVDTGGAFATPIALTAVNSGNTYLLDDAAGLDFTLPALTSANLGTHFRFYLTVEATTNSYRWTAQSGDLLAGHVIVYDKDVAEGSTEALQQIFRPDGSDDLILTIGSADDTQGVLVGGWLEFEAITATGWFVRGSLIGDGALATVFS